MRSVALLAAAAILGLSACGSGREEVPIPADQGPERTGPPNGARVICGDDGTRVEPARVKPQLDGVHVEIVNETGEDLGVNVGDEVNGSYQGLDAPPGTSKEVLDVPPGSIWLACGGPLTDTQGQPATLEIIDEDGVWLEGTGAVPECETSVSGISEYMLDTPGYPTPAEAVRHQFADAFEPGDVLEQLGYPEASPATLALVRGGVSVWGFTVTDYGRGWLVESDSRCG
jgi:hypothetical protein